MKLLSRENKVTDLSDRDTWMIYTYDLYENPLLTYRIVNNKNMFSNERNNNLN